MGFGLIERGARPAAGAGVPRTFTRPLSPTTRRAELRAGFFDLATEHAGITLDTLEKSGDSFFAAPEPFELLFDDDAEAALGLWRAFRKTATTKAEAPGSTMRRVRELLAGKADATRVAEAKDAMVDRIRRDATEGSVTDKVRNHRSRAALARRAGKWNEVEKQLRTKGINAVARVESSGDINVKRVLIG